MTNASSLEHIFFECLAKDTPDERAAFLARACGGDTELLRRVQKMLEAHDKRFLEHTPAVTDAASDAPTGAETPGQRIGDYRLVERLGEGGMGTVWRAEQIEPVQRQVALKLIKAGMDSRQVIARFEAERQALALMDHPNIARVLDGGADVRGRPYFVMDLCLGMPITRYCDERRLSVRERLALFVQVCEAIQHAHQKGVIHRDIKPSNVLVVVQDGRAVPKVIDFGIAKAVEVKLTERTLLTQTGGFVGTLEYMSPEQSARSAAGVDTRSDVYSLGALLYELLTGSTPLSRQMLAQASLMQILRVIADHETQKPSTRLRESTTTIANIAAQRGIDPARLANVVRGELDWIAMRALEKDRDRRYATAADLALDVGRFLAHQPVSAGPPSALYRLRKFARRNRAAIAAASALVVALVVAIGGVGWALRDRAARDADQKRTSADRRARVSAAVQELVASADRQMKAQAWHEALATARRADAAATSGEADAETLQRVHVLLDGLELVDRLDGVRSSQSVWSSSGFDGTAALREYEVAFREHGIDVDTLSVENGAERLRATPALGVPLAGGLDGFAKRHLDAKRDVDACRRIIRVANAIDADPVRCSIRSTWSGMTGPGAGDTLAELARTIDVRAHPAVTLYSLARSLGAERRGAAIEMLRKAQHAHPGDFWLAFELGGALQEENDLEGARLYLTVAVAVRPDSAAAHNNLGNLLRMMGELDAGEASIRRAIELGPRLSIAHLNLGRIKLDQGDREASLASLRKALELDPKSSVAWAGLGTHMLEMHQVDEAEDAYGRAVELDPKNTHAQSGLSDVLRARGKVDEALAMARATIAKDAKYAGAYISLGNALGEKGDLAGAAEAFRCAIEIEPRNHVAMGNLGNALSEIDPPKHLDEALALCRKAVELAPNHAIGHLGLGNVLFHQERIDEAIAEYRKAAEIEPTFVEAHYNLGQLLWKQKRVDEALAAYRRTVELAPDHADARWGMALALNGKNEFRESASELREVLRIRPGIARVHLTLAGVLKDLGDKDGALENYRRAAELEPKVALHQLMLGLAYHRAQRYAEAASTYRAALEIDPKSSMTFGVLGDVLERQGLHEEAENAYRSAIGLDSKYSDAYQGLGAALASQGKLREAIDARELGIRRGKPDADAASDLALLLTTCADETLRDGARAVELARRAAELEPQNVRHQRVLGAAHCRAGKWQAALDALKRADEIAPDKGGFDGFVAAMAHWQLGDKDAARAAYEQADERMRRTHPDAEDVLRLRDEAARLLGIGRSPR